MRVKFGEIKRDAFGIVEAPIPILKTKHGQKLGPLGRYFNLKMELKYNEVSELSFTLPAFSHGKSTPFYERLGGEMLLQVDPYGVFVLEEPDIEGDGIAEKKYCTAHSREYELAGKQIVFGKGVYPLYDPTNTSETILGIAFERAYGWKIGHVSSTLYNRYRSFDQTDSKVLDFLLNDAQKSFGCVFIFDTYSKTVDVIDAEEAAVKLPIYLSFDNLLSQVKISGDSSNMATRLLVSGAEGVDIRNVNPTGTSEIIDLGYHISAGDIPTSIAEKYRSWKNTLYANQAYYTSLISMRNTAYARYLTEKARLADLEGELASLDNLRSVNLQGRAMATEQGPATKEGTVAYFDARLAEIAVEYRQKEQDIAVQKQLLASIQTEYDGFTSDIKAVNDKLRLEAFFTQDELVVLNSYLIDGTFSDPTFAVFDVDISGESDSFQKSTSATVAFSGVTAVDVEMTAQWECSNHHAFSYTGTPSVCPVCGSTSLHLMSGAQRRVLALSGGTITVQGDAYNLSSRLVSGTLEQKDGADVVFSAFLGSGTGNGKSFPSGNLTCVCKSTFSIDSVLAGMERIIETTRDDETGVSHDDVSYYGDFNIATTDNAFYFTRNVTENQRYSVEQELYDYAEQALQELAYPVYEFTVKSGNLIWDQKFEPFKNALELGSAVYLQLNDTTRLKPVLLEVHLDFEKQENFELIFSSRFQTKRPDNVNKLKSTIEKTKSTSRTLDFKQHTFGSFEEGGGALALAKMLQAGYDAALSQIMAGKDQCVTINEAGIKIAAVDGKEYIMLNNGMIALVDSQRNEVKMAMGHFFNAASGTDFVGILADIIGGTLIAGKNLIIECPDVNGGVAQFRVDSSGVFLNNSRFYLQSDGGGKIGMDANYGIFGGPSSLFTVQDTGRVTPSFINSDGTVNFDKYGFPTNTNFWVDIRTGNVYMRGKIYATDGVFNGTIYAKAGEFKGVVQASDFLDSSGNSMMTNGKFKSSVLDLGNIQLDGNTGDITMSGNITMGGNINLSGGKITWGSNAPVKYQFSTSINGPWHDTMQTADKYRRDSLDGGITWGAGYQFRGEDGKPGQNGSDADVPGYIKSTYIDMTTVQSPYIKANILQIQAPNNNSTNGLLLSGYYQNRAYDWLKISYFEGDGPYLYFSSPGGAILNFQNKSSFDNGFSSYGTNTFSRDSTVTFEGSVRFLGSVSGITATFA